jgi:hypothetical protein
MPCARGGVRGGREEGRDIRGSAHRALRACAMRCCDSQHRAPASQNPFRWNPPRPAPSPATARGWLRQAQVPGGGARGHAAGNDGGDQKGGRAGRTGRAAARVDPNLDQQALERHKRLGVWILKGDGLVQREAPSAQPPNEAVQVAHSTARHTADKACGAKQTNKPTNQPPGPGSPQHPEPGQAGVRPSGRGAVAGGCGRAAAARGRRGGGGPGLTAADWRAGAWLRVGANWACRTIMRSDWSCVQLALIRPPASWRAVNDLATRPSRLPRRPHRKRTAARSHPCHCSMGSCARRPRPNSATSRSDGAALISAVIGLQSKLLRYAVRPPEPGPARFGWPTGPCRAMGADAKTAKPNEWLRAYEGIK